jgi:predicted esterase
MEQLFESRLRRYYELELPKRHPGGRRWPLLIALHGYEGNKDSMMRIARRIAAGKMVAISLQAPFQFIRRGSTAHNFRIGFGWGTTWKMEESVALHHSDLRKVIALAVKKYHADSESVFLLGFSQACSYNYRFVFSYPDAIRGVIAVCGGVPGDWDTNPRFRSASTHVLHIAASRDRWYSRAKNLEFPKMLAQRAASVDFRLYQSTHRFPRPAITHIRHWIEKHL